MDAEDFKPIPDEHQDKFNRYHFNSSGVPDAGHLDPSEFQGESEPNNFDDAILPRDTLAFVQTGEDPWAAQRASVSLLHPHGHRASSVRFND